MKVKQPRICHINPKTLEVEFFDDGDRDTGALEPVENISRALIETVVRDMTYVMSGMSIEEAFSIPEKSTEARRLMDGIRGLDDNSIINAVKLSGFVVDQGESVESINPDEATIQNVRTMVERSLRFFDTYGPMVLNGFTFEGGYTDTVISGDGDFTTADTLWDFKVSKARPTKNHTLQLLMYWRMGLHSVHTEFQDICYLGIYNPRLNEVYRISVDDIPDDVIVEVERDVIGYPE